MKDQVLQAARMSLLIGALHSCCPLALYAAPAQPLPCSAPAYRQFDFWLGEWDVFEEGGSTREARATVTRDFFCLLLYSRGDLSTHRLRPELSISLIRTQDPSVGVEQTGGKNK